MPNNTGSMTKDNMVELLPCPFCGGPVKLEKTINKSASGRSWWGVVCRNTIGLGGTCAIQQRPSASVEAATTRWNTRATMHGSDSGALREALVEARAYVSAHHLPGEIFETELLAKIDAALNLSSETGERAE